MSIHWDALGGRYIIRFRDCTGTNRAVTVNAKNLVKYGQHLPARITERVAKKLEAAILARETADDGSIRSAERQRLLWLDAVARYLPPLLHKDGSDTWEARPVGQRLENEKTYSRNQLDRMHRILAVYFPSYLEHDRVKWERRGKRNHHRVAEVYSCARRIGSISREDVAGFQIYLTSEGRLAPSSVRGYVGTLKTFLMWCHKRDYILANPGIDVKLPSGKNHEVRWLEAERAKNLRKATKDHLLEGPVRAILGLGLRRSEMINLEWSDINYDAGIVRVRGTKTDQALREIPLPGMLVAYFKKLKRLEDVQNVLLNGSGRPWNRNSLNSALRRFRAAKYVPFDWNFQMLRATYGSLLVQQGVPISHVSMALGHADVRITQKWYIGLKSTHVAPEISKAINRALS
ncbi:MAG: tyrosine-type recombinase/integrase [Methanosarcinaceae archaeon]|nr:tyrosine-type recombinase/integrase [Methanosarcinaceae archaeon]